MEVYDAIRTVLAVRKYQDKPVSQAVVRKVVEAGRLTASASNRQPWHFIVVEDKEALRKLGELARTGSYTAEAAFAIVVAIEHTPFAVSDASRAIQSMILAGWSEGVGSNWVGFTGLDEVKKVLSIPNEMDVLAILPFGYPADKIGAGKKRRKPLAEVASRERFGAAF